jgi:hypothetical protein
MARPHTTNGYTNPGVRFERSDVNAREVAWFGLGLGALVAVVSVFLVGYFAFLQSREKARKGSTLPPAAVDRERLPPQPRLEALEDVRAGTVRLLPPRAEGYLAGQKKVLLRGDPAKGVLPIDEAIEALSRMRLARKGAAGKPPENYTTRLPSKAASGRVSTGGQ